MGWLWGATKPSSTSPDPAQSPAQQAAGGDDQARSEQLKEQRLATARQKWQDTQQAATPNAADDPEMHKFLEEVMGEVKSMRDADTARAAANPPPDAASNPNKIKVSPWGSRWREPPPPPSQPQPASYAHPDQTSDDNPTNAPRLSPLAEAQLPTTMNCEATFNLAFHCRSLGGQFTNLYRYGEVRSCNEQWADFWFCMRAKGFEEGKVKEDAIREHYRNKELAKYGPGRPSSEDVWRERREKVPLGGAFSEPVPAATRGDAELQKWEMERMESIRKGLREGDDS